jgi:hypothetical protein
MIKAFVLGAAIALVALPVIAADPDCGTAQLVKSAKIGIEACVDPAMWDQGQGSGDQEFVYFSKDQKAGFAIVTEAPAVPLMDYHDAILKFAAAASGGKDPVQSYDNQTPTINGKGWGSMHYDVSVQGSKLEFLNYYYSQKGLGSTQFIFWSAPEDAANVETDYADKVMPTVTVTK